MAIEYVNLDEAKDQCRVILTDTLHDDRLEQLIRACSVMVKNFLGDFSAYEGQRNTDDDYVTDSNYEPEIQLDENGDRVVKAEVKMAVLLLIERFFNGQTEGFQKGELPPEITAILWPLRDPALR